jgi:hypothetical protein
LPSAEPLEATEYKMKTIIPILIILLISCTNHKENQKLKSTDKGNLLDTISCGQNQNLVSINYYIDNKRIDILPVGQKIRAIFTFKGNFKNILSKGEFSLATDNDTISKIVKISENEFDIYINPKLKSENFNYWMILKAENTIFEWDYTIANEKKHEYSDTWDVMQSHPLKNNASNSCHGASPPISLRNNDQFETK